MIPKYNNTLFPNHFCVITIRQYVTNGPNKRCNNKSNPNKDVIANLGSM